MQLKLPGNFSYTVAIAWQAIAANKLRALLTSLGIIFGVGSVIAMLSVGRGAEQEILEQMKLLGANNIVIKPIVEQSEGKTSKDDDAKKAEKKRFSPGLSMEDARGIRAVIPEVTDVSPEIVDDLTVLRNGYKRTAKLVGVEPSYFSLSDFSLSQGEHFSRAQIDEAAPVCIIGSGIRAKFFPQDEPIGKSIKCGNVWLTVVGILRERNISEADIKHLGIRDYNMDVYTPVSTALLRFKNRSLLTRKMVTDAQRETDEDEETSKPSENYNQLDRLTVRVASTEHISQIAETITRMLERRHNRVIDFEVEVPELLLKQEQRTKDIFNIVLGAIASISLVVGGIGIMNIMLASVIERTREIGVRRAIGARSRDITFQFLSEAVTLCLAGGIIGIVFGIAMSFAIRTFASVNTIVTPISVVISFGVAVSVGLVFGIVPARRAAHQDPIEALRYE
ncbi:MAG: ABC transporter permease [Bacteroidetes bacterium]|nr:ABC transporter permease [Bacteroidota bacterium]